MELNTFSDINIDDTGNKEGSINSIFQDDLLERILVYLPFISIISAGLVCKKWRQITTSKRFLWDASQTGSQKPWFWFFKFIGNTKSKPSGYAFDPVLQKWQGTEFLDMLKPFTSFDSSDGLVCFVKDKEIHVCNPITKEHKKLQEPLGTSLCLSSYHVFIRPSVIQHAPLINIWVNRRSHNYNVSVLYCEMVARSHGEFSFQIYDSATMKWTASQLEILTGWTSDRKSVSVICNGVLYFQVSSIWTGSGSRKEYGLLAYNLSSDLSSHGTLINSFIPLPCSVICGLMNLKEKLIMVGAFGRSCGEELNSGFSIFLLKGKDWQEISRITDTCFYDRCEAFNCSGADDLIYIHGNYLPQLVVFDMNSKQWTCCQECPTKDVFNGFCLQPRLDISP